MQIQSAKVKGEEIIKRPVSFLDSPVKPDYDEGKEMRRGTPYHSKKILLCVMCCVGDLRYAR